MSSVDEALRYLAEKGVHESYGEDVTTTDHSLQAAALARRARAGDALVAAALLHDVGHFLHGEGEDCAERGIDDRHEASGAAWLRARFSSEVADPVALHVEAKRYLVATEPRYRERLSEASIRSLALQGGPMDADEASRFRALPGADDAIRLRRWDDAAKVPGAETPSLESFRPLLSRLAGPVEGGTR